jgi:hypothetical protein
MRISDSLRRQVRERAKGRCEYCQTPEWLIGIRHEIDHVIPKASEGSNTADNLCLACAACNGYKHAKTVGDDEITGEQVSLFHPRRQHWHDHFAWSEDGTEIIGKTPCGRVTVSTLRLNHPLVVTARSIWVGFGAHPPGVQSEEY